jgi:serine/threonine protein kinase
VTIPAGTLVPRDARDFGSYQLIAKLATGGMAEIYLARPSGSAKDLIVLKRILPHLAEDEHFVQMFRDEADLAAKLVHRNVCAVSAFGQYANTWYIAMEYLHGVPLSRMMTKLSKAQKMLDVRVVAGIICQACEGLHAAHEARGPDGQLLGVVHRDVSPPNIMVTADGTVKLLDFGIAKARGANSRTRTGTVKGKNAYMSPEQILGKPLDRRSDIFALGVVMYEMLSIRRLFHRDSDFLTFKAITEEPIPDLRERRPDLPPGMRAALLQAMARDPAGRFETAQQFGNAIRNSIATQGGPAAQQDLARLLFTDFSDEMAARDEIMKAADDPGASTPVSVGRAAPPPIPVRATRPPVAASGEMSQGKPQRPTGGLPVQAVPSMIVSGQGSTRVAVPSTESQKIQVPPDLSNVPDLSNAITPDTWMGDAGTDLLSQHRWKSLRNTVFALALLAAIAVGVFYLVGRGDKDKKKVAAPVPVQIDAGVKVVQPPPPDAPEMTKDDIYALSKYGFFSINASAKTTIYIDGARIAETPLTRLPISPGPHVVKAVGPRGKSKTIKIVVLGGQDTDEGMINW